jgi:hypothetical protein
MTKRAIPERCPEGAFRFRDRPPMDEDCVTCKCELFDDDFVRWDKGGLRHHDCPQITARGDN